MGTSANSGDPDELQHKAAFHQGLHCLLRLQHSGTEIHHHNLETLKIQNGQYPLLMYQYVWKIHQNTKG